MSQTKFVCSKCGRNNKINNLRLSPFWNKFIKISCKNCGNTSRIFVNEALLSGNIKVDSNKPRDKETIIVTPKFHKNEIGKIHVLENEETNHQILDLQEGENIIGRQSADDLHLTNKVRILTRDIMMSRNHCSLVVEKKTDKTYRYILFDLGSLNGTFYFNEEKEKRLEKDEKIVIEPGNIISLGYRTKFKVVL